MLLKKIEKMSLIAICMKMSEEKIMVNIFLKNPGLNYIIDVLKIVTIEIIVF